MACRFIACLLGLFLLATAVRADDRLGLPGPLEFDGEAYRLAWSAQPSPTYIKQEYVPAGQSVERYTAMLLVETVTGGVGVKEAVAAQAAMLKRRKATDPLVNMALVENRASGEVLLDFILGGKDAAGQPIVEWNAYRYAPHGKGGVMLFGISRRAYGEAAARDFLRGLKNLRPAQIAALAKAPLPRPRD